MKKGLKLLLCVDWEGLSLEERNLKSLREFRKRWAIPLLHFMNPAYFTSKSLFSRVQELDFSEWVETTDLWGLHLHGTRHFVEACEVEFQKDLTFSRQGDQNPRDQQGLEVMLHSYSSAEFGKMLKQSLRLFQQQGLPPPKIFRAGGWMSHPQFAPILLQNKVCMESSAASPQVLQGSCWQDEPLQKYLSLLWGDLDHRSQPFYEQGLLQIPNNLGAIDYWGAGKVDAFQWALELADFHQPLAVVTLHQETAADELWKLEQWLQNLTEKIWIEPVVSLTELRKSYFSPSLHSAISPLISTH